MLRFLVFAFALAHASKQNFVQFKTEAGSKSSLTVRKRFCRMQSLVAFGNRALKKPL